MFQLKNKLLPLTAYVLENFHQPENQFSLVKAGLSSSKKVCVISLIESPLKIMKNVFYFYLKARFFLKIFKFLSRPFGHVGKTA